MCSQTTIKSVVERYHDRILHFIFTNATQTHFIDCRVHFDLAASRSLHQRCRPSFQTKRMGGQMTDYINTGVAHISASRASAWMELKEGFYV